MNSGKREIDLSEAAYIDASLYDFSSVRASVSKRTGALNFGPNAKKFMGFKTGDRLLMFKQHGGNLATVLVTNEDSRGFRIYRNANSGYIKFQKYLDRERIDYKHNRIVYDISRTLEKYMGKTVYLLTQSAE